MTCCTAFSYCNKWLWRLETMDIYAEGEALLVLTWKCTLLSISLLSFSSGLFHWQTKILWTSRKKVGIFANFIRPFAEIQQFFCDKRMKKCCAWIEWISLIQQLAIYSLKPIIFSLYSFFSRIIYRLVGDCGRATDPSIAPFLTNKPLFHRQFARNRRKNMSSFFAVVQQKIAKNTSKRLCKRWWWWWK